MSSPIDHVQFFALPVDHKKLERSNGLLMWRAEDAGRAKKMRCKKGLLGIVCSLISYSLSRQVLTDYKILLKYNQYINKFHRSLLDVLASLKYGSVDQLATDSLNLA